jgi:hypothetical protein
VGEATETWVFDGHGRAWFPCLYAPERHHASLQLPADDTGAGSGLRAQRSGGQFSHREGVGGVPESCDRGDPGRTALGPHLPLVRQPPHAQLSATRPDEQAKAEEIAESETAFWNSELTRWQGLRLYRCRGIRHW